MAYLEASDILRGEHPSHVEKKRDRSAQSCSTHGTMLWFVMVIIAWRGPCAPSWISLPVERDQRASVGALDAWFAEARVGEASAIPQMARLYATASIVGAG